MSLIQNFISDLPIYLLSLPVALLSLSIHECAHGYAALRLGDPTARNLGRLTLDLEKCFFTVHSFLHVSVACV